MKTIKLLLIVILFLFAAKSLWARITIMPLGDSVTLGIGPSDPLEDLNGYRRDLWNLLESSGYDVDFVGSSSNGTFVEKQHEGHPGWRDDQIATYIYDYLGDNPANIILLHIGTNALDTSPDDVENILDNIDQWEYDNNQTIIVVLSKIINRQNYVCGDPSTTSTFNSNLEQMAQRRTNDRIVIVDMECGADIDYRLATSGGDMIDLLHPDVSGYEKMAVKWLDALLTILPQADAGDDQSVIEKTLVTLDGSGSFDPGGASLSYLWEQIPQVPPRTPVTLSDQTAENPTFTAPEVKLSGERLEFKLTVTDADGFQNSDTVLVDSNDVLLPPVADAGADQTVAPGTKVTLNGSNSYDPDGTITSVQWEQISGKAQVTLTTPTDLTTDFTAPAVDSDGDALTFKLTVKDSDDLVSDDIVNVTITPAAVSAATSNGGGGGGCFIQSVMN